MKLKGYKYRNFLMRNFDEEMADRFRSRNLNDTRYACRVILSLLKQKYYKDKTQVHVAARPGSITALVRKSWGLERIKKDADGKRLGDRHHALDAAIVAAVTEGQLQRLTKLWQWQEAHGQKERVPHITPPWPHFADELKAKLETVFVSRSESGRARGEGHEATIRQVWADKDGEEAVYERKKLDKTFKKEWLVNIKDPDSNKEVVKAIAAWCETDRKELPKHPGTGHDISKIRVKTEIKVSSGFRLDEAGSGRGGGHVKNAGMVRVDVFSRKEGQNQAERFYLVPIYTHQAMDPESFPAPPNRAAKGGTVETDWPEMANGAEFKFSLFPNSFIETINPRSGEIIEGYFRGMDRATASVTLSLPRDKQEIVRSIGVYTLKSFRKFHIDRLGNKHEIKQETRTWHGKVCT